MLAVLQFQSDLCVWQKICFHDLLSSPFIFLPAINKQCKWYIFLNCSSLSHAKDRRKGVWGHRENPSTTWDRTTEKTNIEDGIFWGSLCLQEQDKDKCFLLSIPANVISLSKASCSLWPTRNWKTVETPVKHSESESGEEHYLSPLLHDMSQRQTKEGIITIPQVKSIHDLHTRNTSQRVFLRSTAETTTVTVFSQTWSVLLPIHQKLNRQVWSGEDNKEMCLCSCTLHSNDWLYKVRSLWSWIAWSGSMQVLLGSWCSYT